MSDIAISVQNLSKRYRIGKSEAQTTKRRSITRRIASPFQYLYSTLRQPAPDEVFWALKDVSFEVKHGEVLGIIGRNGAGKTTLLKILSRITEPTSGRAILNGRVGSLLEVGTGFHPELTGRENIYLSGAILGMKKAEIDRKLDEIVDFSGVEKFIDTPVKRYSSGMHVRLAFAVAAYLEPEILLVDEVLAVGDAEFQKKCLGKMGTVAREGRTILFVSHNLIAIEHLCNSGIVFNHGNHTIFPTATEAVIYYENSILRSLKSRYDLPDHVIYQKQDSQDKKAFEITKIEILDKYNQPKSQIYTWDCLKIRIHYSSTQTVNTGSLVLRIADPHGVTLLMTSTQPDQVIQLSIKPGEHFGDCEIDNLPLSGGEYIIGSGLAIPKKEWLCWEESLAKLTVQACDVYQSGLAPISSRSLLAIRHTWKV